MNYRNFCLTILIAWIGVLAARAPAFAERPNILLIMADDVGIEGLECYGGTSYRTPNLNRLASEGVRFTRAYSQPLCTPTRVQIMSGKYNHRNWRYFGILDPAETTFGHRLQQAGYRTGIFGKWQLHSYDPPDLPGAEKRRGTGMHPANAGFHEYSLFHALHTEDKGSRYANPTVLERLGDGQEQLKTFAGQYGEDIWVDRIIDFFDRNRSKPTFVYYPMALPHWPFEPTPNSDDWDPSNVPEADVRYAKDMIEYMDTSVGNVISGLKAKGLDKNLLVLFYSDNGTHLKVQSEMADGRIIQGGKATTQQTGIHVPLIAHWPGQIDPGIDEEIVDASDFVPTLMEIAGQPVRSGEKLDGISFAGRLQGNASPSRQAAFFWYDPRPGWDKERFRREVFAVNKSHKLFRGGRLFRLTDQPLEEIEVDPLAMSDADRVAASKLNAVIEASLAGSIEPPLVDAYGEEEWDFQVVPADRAAADKAMDQLLTTGETHRYGELAEQQLWVFKPLDLQPEEQRGCVFFVHGGGWAGHPRMLAAQAVYLQRRGYTSIVIHFRAPRTASKGRLAVTPADTLADVKVAYRWMIDHSKELQIDTKRIVASGGSAGGHLSLALATIGDETQPTVDPLPAGLVLLNPVIDIVDGWQSGARKCLAAGIDPKSFSPAHHVRAGLPTTLVLSGSEDRLIPPPLIRAFGNRMQESGNQFRFVEYPGADHGFFNYGRNENQYFQWTMWEFERFLSEVMR